MNQTYNTELLKCADCTSGYVLSGNSLLFRSNQSASSWRSELHLWPRKPARHQVTVKDQEKEGLDFEDKRVRVLLASVVT